MWAVVETDVAMIGFCPLASGSKGNCIYLGTARTKILIDAGISARAVEHKLAQLQVELKQIDAICVTHEHGDHIRGLRGLAGKWGIPIFANLETANMVTSTLQQTPRCKIFTTGEPFVFGDLRIRAFSVQHDAVDPVGFVVHLDGLKLGFCTDLGFVTTQVAHELKECDFLYLESNHQPSMVHSCNRPSLYKQRVLSRLGHLSNEACATLLARVAHPKLRHVHLAHLSSECNHPDLALKIAHEALLASGYHVPLSIAMQEQVSHPILFS